MPQSKTLSFENIAEKWKRKKDKWYNLMKCFVVNPQFNGYSLYVHIKYHTVMMKVILYGRLCSIEHCFHCDILLRHGMSHSINAKRLTVTLRAIHKVCTLKYSKYLTLSPPCTQYNKRITSLKQQRYSFA